MMEGNRRERLEVEFSLCNAKLFGDDITSLADPAFGLGVGHFEKLWSADHKKSSRGTTPRGHTLLLNGRAVDTAPPVWREIFVDLSLGKHMRLKFG